MKEDASCTSLHSSSGDNCFNRSACVSVVDQTGALLSQDDGGVEVRFGGRVLLVLQDQGLIKLRPEAGLKATPLDVIDNPKKLKFIELEAAQLPRALDDLDAAAINTNFALSAGLNPGKDAIAQENAKSPYVNIIAVREQDKDKPWVAKLLKAYHSEDTRKFIQSEFKGSVLAGF